MPFSAQDQARLDALDNLLGSYQAPTPQAPPPMSIGQRVLQQAANLPINVGNALGNTVGDLVQIGAPDDERSRMGDDPAGNFYNIPAPRTTGEQAVDIGANLVSQLPAYMIPETGIAKVLGGGRLARIAGAAGAGYLNTQGTEGQAGGAEQAGIMGLMSALGGAGRAQRLIPSLLLGAGAGAVASEHGASDNSAIVQGGVTSLLTMLPGAHVNPAEISGPLGKDVPASGVRGVTPKGPSMLNDAMNPPMPPPGPYPLDSSFNPLANRISTSTPTQAFLDQMHAPPGTSAEASAQVFQGQTMNMPALSGASAADSANAMMEQKYGLIWNGNSFIPASRPAGMTIPDNIGTTTIHPADWIASEKAAGRQPSVLDVQRRYKLSYEQAETLLGQNRPGPIELFNRTNTDTNTAVNGTNDRTADLAQQRLIGGEMPTSGGENETSQPSPILPGPANGRGQSPIGALPPSRFRLIGGEPGAYPSDVQLPVTPRIDMPLPATPSFQLDAHPDLPFSGQAPAPLLGQPNPTGLTRRLPLDAPTFPEGHPGRALLQAHPNSRQVISSAVRTDDGRVLVGKDWNEGHEGIGIRHADPLSDDFGQAPRQDQRGFLVHDRDGTQRFATRDEALPYAKEAGQVPSDFDQTLNSQDLKEAGTYSEKGTGDVAPTPVETSQPAADTPLPIDHPANPHGPRFHQLMQVLDHAEATGTDPVKALKGLTKEERQGMFEAVRSQGKKAGTIAKLAEVGKELRDSRPTEAPSPKPAAALGGAPDALTSDISHFDPDTRDEIQYRRDEYNAAKVPGYTGDSADADFHMRKLREAMGLPEEQPDLPTDTSARILEIKNRRFDTSGAYGDETSQYSMAGTHEDILNKQDLTDDEAQKLNQFDPTDWEAEKTKTPTPQTQMSDALREILEDKDLDIDYRAAEAEHARLENEAEARRGGEPTPDETSQPAAETTAAKKPRAPRKPKLKDAEQTTRDIADKKPANKRATRAARKASGLKQNQAEAGFVDAEMLAYLSRVGVGTLGGGAFGANMDQENRLRGFLWGAALGGFGMHLGPKFIKLLMNEGKAKLKAELTNINTVAKQPGAELPDLMHNVAAQDAGATGDGVAQFARRVQKLFTLSDDAREILSRSNLSGMLSTLEQSLRGMREDWGKLSSAEQDIYRKYQSQPGYVTDPYTGKKVFNTMVETQYLSDMNAHADFATKSMTARRLRIEAQEMIANSMLPDALKTTIEQTLGTYHTDAFRIFNEQSYRPTDVQIDKVVDELTYNKLFPGFDKMNLRKIVGSYLDNIYRSRQLYQGGGSNARTLDQIMQSKMRVDPKLEAKILAATGLKSLDEVVTSQRVLPKELSAALTKEISDGNYLTPAFREMLGYYKDPLEKEAATLIKLIPAARVAKQFELITAGINKLGMKLAITGEESSQMGVALTAQLKTAATAAERDLINKKLLDLRNRTPLPASEAYGVLAGKLVPTDLADTLPDMDKGIYGANTTLVGRGVDQFNRFLKVGQTAMNPVSHIRQIMTTPILAAMANTSPADLWEGFKVARGKGKYEAVLGRMRELGIADTASINTEFNTQARMALTGYYDRTVMDKFLQVPVVSHIVEAYHYPDTALRIGTFLKHEQRLTARMAVDVSMGARPSEIPAEFMPGKSVDQVAAKWAEREALRYTNRYTMNYANIPGGLTAMRKIPFVSLYLSYQYEIARIMKNVTMDALHGTGTSLDAGANRMKALAKIAGVAAVPYALEKMSVSNLSPDDQKEWEASRRMDQPYAQDRYKYVLGKREDGSFKYLDFSPLIPTDEWNRMLRAVGDGSVKNVLANNPIFGLDNTPALNIASELITGQSSRTGRPINTFARAADAARQEVAPAMFGGYEFDNLMRALQANDKGDIGIQRLGSGKGYSIGDLAFTYATGLRPTSVNVDWQRHTAVQQFNNQISVEKQYMMDTLRSNMTNEAKQAAISRYNDAVQSIAAHFHQQVMDAPTN